MFKSSKSLRLYKSYCNVNNTCNSGVRLLEQLLLLLLVDSPAGEERAAVGGRPTGHNITAQDFDRPARAATREAVRAVRADAADGRRAGFRENARVENET